jgi:transposase
MSLPSFSTQQSLFNVGSLANKLFAPDDRYELFAQHIWPLLVAARPQLARMYCADNGRAAVEPVLLLGVTLLQFLDRAADRQAMELLKLHLGWKRALHRDLDDGAPHPTVLVYFRERLLANQQASLAFDTILDGMSAAGLIPAKRKQRLDSTHVLGLLRRMSNLDCVRETMRLALLAIEKLSEPRPDSWSLWRERYVESTPDYRAEETTLKDKFTQAGADIHALLQWLQTQPTALREHCAVALLQRVWNENYELVENKSVAREARPTAAVQNPHEPDAHWANKSSDKKTEWVGYKVQVAESLNDEPLAEGEPTKNVITSVVTQPASHSDEAGMEATFKEQTRNGMDKPRELYVDGAYVSAAALAQAREEKRELMGPAQPSASRAQGFRTEDFDVDIEQRRALCPAGKTNTQCSQLKDKKSGKISYRFEWSTHCHHCPLRQRCVGKDQRHRTLVVGEHHNLLQARRRDQKTESFRERYKVRAGIEGTQSEMVRAHGMRRARYRGLAKVTLQNYFIGAACNVKRWLRRLAWQMQTQATGVAIGVAPAPA